MEHLHSRIPYAQCRLRGCRPLRLPSVLSKSTFLYRHVSSGQSDPHHKPDTTTTSNNPQNAIDDSYNNTPNSTPSISASHLLPQSPSIINRRPHRELRRRESMPRHPLSFRSAHNDTPDSTPSISPSSLLPQSPLITDPNPHREIRHRKKRASTASDPSKLALNPWAMALASPIRQCNLSGARMPRALLTEWGMVEGPVPAHLQTKLSTNEPGKEEEKRFWFLPVSLIKEELNKPTAQGKSKAAVRPHLSVRMLDRMPIMEKVTRSIVNTGKHKTPISKLIPVRWRPPLGPMTMADEKKIVWRPDMPGYMLKMMRRQALGELKGASAMYKRQDVPDGVWTSIDVESSLQSEEALVDALKRMKCVDRMGYGAVLVLGGPDSEAGAGADKVSALPEHVTLPELGTQVPIFDLRRLFSQVELDEIRAYHERFQKSAVFLRPEEPITVGAILSLWKIQGYIRDGYRP
ncbi:hypothetical protein BJX99DRAFT_252722 [Aspergillus californicus]